MANMTFKANLLPNSDGGYSLGSASDPKLRWKINGKYPFLNYFSNIDYSTTAPEPGAYSMEGQTHPVTGVTEYGSALSLSGKTEGGNDYYAAQLIISSPSGVSNPVHAYIRRLVSTPAWTDWSTLLDDKNYNDYCDLDYVKKSGDTMTGTLIINKTQDASGTADNKPALIVGGLSTAAHIEIDNNEILAKSNGTTPTTLYLHDTTGTTQVAGSGGLKVWDITIAGDATTDANKRTIKSASTLYLDRGSGTSLLFELAGSEHARWDTSGHLKPAATNTYQLGLSGSRWKAAFIGTADSYGGTTQPIYWDSGVPKAANAYSTLLTAFSTSTNTISITVGGTTKTTTAVTGVSNAWTAGTTAGPKIATTVNGVAGTAVAIPSASETASGVITTGNQNFAGLKKFGYLAMWGKNTSNSATRYVDIVLQNGAGTQVGEVWYDIGNATNITSGRYWWRQYSPNTTANTSTTGFYEQFALPAVTAGLTANATYQIFTSKDYTTLDGRYVNISGDTMTGDLIRSRASGGDAAVAILNTDTTLRLRLLIGSGKSNHGIYSNGYVNSSGTFTASNTWIIYRGADMYVHCGTRLYGAVWNDYAEYRETKENIEPGRCVREVGDGLLILTTERLQKGCEIVSDTFGFAIGKSEKCQTPTAASGRVLAYCLEGQEEAKKHIGDPVCSGPNGTVSIMTEEEERLYPSRIIGTISEIPTYNIWIANEFEGDTKEEIKVNGRIWIRIR